MNASLNQTSNDELESTTFPSVSKELSKVQPVSQNLPPNDAKASPVEPVTQTATVSTVVTTVNPNVTVQPVCDQPAHIVSSNTLQTTVVTTVGSTSVASVADVGAAISIAATAAQREPTDSSTIPSSSAVQDNILQSTKEPVVSSVPETLSKTKVSLQNLKSSKDENYEIENENQQLKELIADIRWKRDKFRLLNGKLENEIKRQLQLINKYRSFLISTFESRPTYAFQQIFERLKGQIPDSSKKYVKEKHDWSCPEERRQQVPSGVSRLENTASANASAMTWNHFAKASASAVNTKHRNSSESSELTGSSTYVDRPLTGANQFQERSFKGKILNWKYYCCYFFY